MTTNAKPKNLRFVQGNHQAEPTCDNCPSMIIRHTGSGNHRYCGQMHLFIPDYEMFPSCENHPWINRLANVAVRKGGKL